MANNDFLPFAGGVGSNVLSQAAYAALAARTAGFSAGVAKSAELNKVWRQSSILAAVLAQFIADNSGADSIDDGTTATLLANLKQAINAAGVTAAQFDSSTKLATTAFVKRAGFQFSNTTFTTAGPISLTASQAGSFLDLGSAYTGDITLPLLSSVPDGAIFYIWSGASATLNVQRSGADPIFVSSSQVTSIAMKTGDTLVIGKSGPANSWVAMWGSAQFPFSGVYNELAPKPVIAAGKGQWQSMVAAVNSALTLPAGGTWAYFALPFSSAGASQSSVSPLAGVAAGGTIIAAAVASQYWYGLAWRLQ